MPEKKRRRKYTKEFKLEAIQLAEQRGNAAEVARNLGIKANMLTRWIREYKADQKYAFPGLGRMKEPEEELRQMQKKLADVEEERDILKKALAIFSKENPRSSSS
jgi:transposase